MLHNSATRTLRPKSANALLFRTRSMATHIWCGSPVCSPACSDTGYIANHSELRVANDSDNTHLRDISSTFEAAPRLSLSLIPDRHVGRRRQSSCSHKCCNSKFRFPILSPRSCARNDWLHRSATAHNGPRRPTISPAHTAPTFRALRVRDRFPAVRDTRRPRIDMKARAQYQIRARKRARLHVTNARARTHARTHTHSALEPARARPRTCTPP